MAAAKGNDYAKKLKTKEIKDKVYKDYCEHIAKGYPHKAWYYEKDGLSICYKTIENYLDKDEDFPSSQKNIAEAKALRIYIDLGREIMMGNVEKAQPAIYQIFMRNMFSWDKPEVSKEEAKGAFNTWTKDQKK